MSDSCRKILMVLYYFPPAASGGTYRPLKFIRYLTEFGYHCVVIAPTKCRYESQDHTLLAEIPHGTEIIRVNSGVESTWYYHLMRKVGMGDVYEQTLIPDRQIGFAQNAIRVGKDRIAKGDIDLIFTSSTPYSVHIAGMELAKESGLKWVADFRDPWIADPFYYPVTLDRDKKNRELEKKVFESADSIISFPEIRAQIERERYPEHAKKIISIENGFDPADFPSVNTQEKSGKITITHVGAITTDRTVTQFLKALSDVISRNESLKGNVNLEFYGDSRPPTPNEIVQYHLSDLTRLNGYVSHSDACNAMTSSNLLFMVLPDREGAEKIMPLRLFEYVYSNTPVFLVSPPGVASDFLTQTNAGVWVDIKNQTEINQKLESMLLSIINNTYTHAPNPEPLKKFERRALTQKLAQLFDSHLTGG